MSAVDAPPPAKAPRAVTVQAPIVEVPERPLDLWLMAAILGLVTIGTIEIFSSSAVYAASKHGDSYYFLKRQLVWLTIGFGALWVGANTDYSWLRRWTYPMLFGAVLLLVGVLLFGSTLNGARRWFIIGPLSMQPVELAKLALITYLAYTLSRKAEKVRTFTIGFVPPLVVCAVMMVLLLRQPDLGSSIILGATTLTLLFIAGTKVSFLAGAILAAAPIAYHFVVATPWRLQRFMAFFNPEAYSQGVAYQIMQSRIAIGSGGVTGLGLGESRQQHGYMPEGHSDFIMSTVGEELGFIGFVSVLALFVVVIWRGARAALSARDSFGTYLAFGITVTFALQAVINTGVVLGALPAKGLTLPLVSYGGSSLVVALYLMGVLLNVARRTPRLSPNRELVQNFARRRKQRAVIVCG